MIEIAPPVQVTPGKGERLDPELETREGLRPARAAAAPHKDDSKENKGV